MARASSSKMTVILTGGASAHCRQLGGLRMLALSKQFGLRPVPGSALKRFRWLKAGLMPLVSRCLKSRIRCLHAAILVRHGEGPPPFARSWGAGGDLSRESLGLLHRAYHRQRGRLCEGRRGCGEDRLHTLDRLRGMRLMSQAGTQLEHCCCRFRQTS